MQELLRYICENGFEHHVAANFSTTAAPVYEAASKKYLGWEDALASVGTPSPVLFGPKYSKIMSYAWTFSCKVLFLNDLLVKY